MVAEALMVRYLIPTLVLLSVVACREASQPQQHESAELTRLRGENSALKAQVAKLSTDLESARSTPYAFLERAEVAYAQRDWTTAKQSATNVLEHSNVRGLAARAKQIEQEAARHIAAAERDDRAAQRDVPVAWVLTGYQEAPERGATKLRVKAKSKCFDQWNIRRIEWSADANDSSRAAAAFSGTPLTDLRVSISGVERDRGAPTLVITTHRGNKQFSLPLGEENRNRTFAYDAVMPTFWSEAQLLCD
jgi:hypothetical protein